LAFIFGWEKHHKKSKNLDALSALSKILDRTTAIFYSRTKTPRHKGSQSGIKIFVSWWLCVSFPTKKFIFRVADRTGRNLDLSSFICKNGPGFEHE
jgi:hypothetical protein